MMECRKFSKRQFIFRAAQTPDRSIFNHELPIYLVWLDKKQVLHIADTHKHFQNAVTFRSEQVEDVWFDFLEDWAPIYVGSPNVIRLDQESTFRSQYITSVTHAMGIELQFSGVEYKNYIGAGDKYYASLR